MRLIVLGVVPPLGQPSNDQVADGFTKALPQGKLLEFQHNLNLIKL
jgi:hypothetical protein